MAPRSKKDKAMKPAAETSVESPRAGLKRKRSINEFDGTLEKVVKSIRADRGLPIAASIENGGTPPRDTTSETSGLTSADEAITSTSATGVDSDESKQVSEVRGFSVEGSRIAEIVTAYRNAMEILVEIANRDRYRAHAQPYMGPGGQAQYSTPYASGPVSTYTTPYASGFPNTYTTPYANTGPTNYVTPYSNPPVVAERSGTSRSNAVVAPEAHAFDHSSLENQTALGSRDEANAEMIIDDREGSTDVPKETTRDDDAISLSSALNIDNFLALANGGVPPGPDDDTNDSDHEDTIHISKFTALDAPPSPADTIDESLSRADEDIQALVNNIANGLMHSEEAPNQVPPGNPYAAFYSTMNGKQLGAELKRLVAVAHPEVNAIMPREQIQAAHLFYTHLVSRAHTRNAANIRQAQVNHHAPFAAPNQWGQAIYPPPPPKGYMVQWHDSFTGAPLQPPGPMGQSFVPRGNVIAPPAVRNIEQERKIATYGFPPKPSRRPGLRSGGKRGRQKE